MDEQRQAIASCDSLVDVARVQAELLGDRVAYRFLRKGDVDGPIDELTYEELDRRCRSLAARLQAMDVSGERALLLYPPGLEYVIAYLGCLYAGVVAVPAYPPDPNRLERTLPRLRAIVKDESARNSRSNSFT